MKKSRRNFIKDASASAVGLTMAPWALGNSAKSYSRIIGANDRLRVAIVGLGRRLGAYYEPIALKESNVELVYLCDVMDSQLERASAGFAEKIDYEPKLEKDVRKIINDDQVDAIINATPDHWHTPMAIMALEAGKHVYLEKPVSHNPYESELLIQYNKKHKDKLIQMGAQQRSSDVSKEIIDEIHNGIIGEVYKALTFYSNRRGRVVNPKIAPVPDGLNWELFQGPAPRKPYEHDTWDYNWHWYGWDYGTAETGNNATHELDVARWALQVGYPEYVFVEAAKRHFKDDGWTMYDTMDATFIFPDNKVIQWDGKSRNGYKTHQYGRGVYVFGTEGTVFLSRSIGYKLYDRAGELIRERMEGTDEAGTALGGGGGLSTRHMLNFFNSIRGKEDLTLPISDGVVSQYMTHVANIAYRVNKPLEVNTENGRIFDRDAMKLWKRTYEPGWEPKAL